MKVIKNLLEMRLWISDETAIYFITVSVETEMEVGVGMGFGVEVVGRKGLVVQRALSKMVTTFKSYRRYILAGLMSVLSPWI